MRVTTQAAILLALASAACAQRTPVPAAPAAPPAPPIAAAALPAKVLRVIDGDTLVVDATWWVSAGGQARRVRDRVTVRVLGVDTPELKAKTACERELAQRAAAFTRAFAGAGHQVQIDPHGVDAFGRLLAHVRRADGQDLAEALQESGFARVYGGRQVWCS